MGATVLSGVALLELSAQFFLGGRIRNKVGSCYYYECFEEECVTYFLIWAATNRKGTTRLLVRFNPLLKTVSQQGDHTQVS
jgi:hypothetical protein